MAVLKHMVGQKVIDGSRGTIDYYYWMTIPCARAWPKSPGKIRSPAVMAQWPIFTTATRLWQTLSPIVKQAYIEMAAQTVYRPQDLFVRGYINGHYRYFRPPP